MITSPCFRNGVHCGKRELGCHAKCKEYQEWSNERRRIREAAYLGRQAEEVSIERHIKRRHEDHRRRR